MSRKLASIRQIKEIVPIEGADKIELAKIDGWQCVVAKGEFEPGDNCVYFEVDSFLPVRKEFEFLRKGCFRSTQHLGDGFRIKTIKLRGQLSQGLAMPVSKLADLILKSDEDLDTKIGVKKWEDPIHPSLAGKVRGNFPSFIPKTDQERIQNLYDKLVDKYKDDYFDVTIKLDGSSMTVYWHEGRMGVCSRNLDLEETPDNTFWKVARNYAFETVLSTIGKNIALQGELMGPGVQGNREALPNHMFFLFDIYLIDERRYANTFERANLESTIRAIYASKFNDGIVLDTAPFVGMIQPFHRTLDELLEYASQHNSIVHNVPEGLVFRHMEERCTFKVINNEFLLSEK